MGTQPYETSPVAMWATSVNGGRAARERLMYGCMLWARHLLLVLQPVGASVRRSPDLVTLLGRVMSACRLFALAFHCWTYWFRWSY